MTIFYKELCYIESNTAGHMLSSTPYEEQGAKIISVMFNTNIDMLNAQTQTDTLNRCCYGDGAAVKAQ